MDDKAKLATEERESKATAEEPSGGGGGGGWGGWGFSPLSYLSDLQKVAAVAAEEISRNAAAAAETAAKSIAELQNVAEDSESSKGEEDAEDPAVDAEDEDKKYELRKSALDKLEKASEDSILSEGLKGFDDSVENLASGAWKALGNAWKGSSAFLQKIEHSATNLAEKHGGPAGSAAPSLLETGRAFTAKGMQVLENVGKETMELLMSETGFEVDRRAGAGDHQVEGDQLYEETTFDRCFYIYGGPEHLEELEALSNHHALLFNRRKGKLSPEQKSMYEGKLKLVQQILDLDTETDAALVESDKGKNIETRAEGSDNEMKSLHDLSVSKAADMAAGFTNALSGLAANDIIQRTAGRLESLHSEGIHRISEICCFAVSQLLMLGKSIISNANKMHEEDASEEILSIEWPDDSLDKARIIRSKALSMTGSIEAVSNSFITGIADVAEAYLAAIKGAAAESHVAPPQKSIQEKASAFTQHLRADQTIAISKLQDGLEYLSFVVLSASMPSA